MNIRSSTALRSDYNRIADIAKETREPVFITKNGEGDTVMLSIDAYQQREQMLNLRERLLIAERERLAGQTVDAGEADRKLREKFNERT